MASFYSYTARIAGLTVAFAVLIGSFNLSAQISGERKRELLQQAGEQLAGGRYQDAIRTLQPITSDPTALQETPRAPYMAGIAHYMLNDYEKAVELLANRDELRESDREIAAFHYGAAAYALQKHEEAIAALKTFNEMAADDIINLELRPYALLTLARAHIGKAESTMQDDPEAGRAEAANALPIIEKLLADPEVEALQGDAQVVKAIALTLSDDLTAAEALLTELRDQPDSNLSENEINKMLGFILSKRYRQLQAEFREEEATQVIERTRSIYQNLLEVDDLAIANEAAFELANLELASNNQDAAFDAFRAIRSKSDIVQSVEEQLASLRRDLQQAAGNATEVKRVNRELRRVQQKLQQIQGAPDLALSALIRIADTYLQMTRYDEARVVYRYVSQFLDEGRKAAIDGQIVVTLALQGKVEEAEQKFTEIRSANADSPIIQSIPFLMGNALLQQGEYEKAITQFNRNMEEFPESPVTDQIPAKMATAYRGLATQAKTKEEVQKFMDQAVATLQDFIKKAEANEIRVPRASIEEAQLQLAQTLVGQNKISEAETLLNQLSSDARTPEIKETAAFTLAGLYEQQKQVDQAIQAYQKFASDFPGADKADDAAFRAALLTEQSGNMDQARTAYENFISTYPESNLRVSAYGQIWKSYKSEKNWEQMEDAQESLITAFPTSVNAANALLDRLRTYNGLSEEQYKQQVPSVADRLAKMITSLRDQVTPAEFERLKKFANYAFVIQADTIRDELNTLGPSFASLESDAARQQFIDGNQKVVDLMQRALTEFPNNELLSFNFSRLNTAMVNLVQAGSGTVEQFADFFSSLAGTTRNEKLKAAALLGRADLYFNAGRVAESQPLYGLAFKEVDDPQAMNWRQYDRYGSQLVEQGEWAQLTSLADQLESAWGQDPKFGDLSNSTALFWRAKSAEAQGNTSRAEQLYSNLKANYPNSPKIMEINYGLAMGKIRDGKFDPGISDLQDITRSPRAPNDLKARSLIDIALTLEKMAKQGLTSEFAQRGGEPVDMLDIAANNLQRVEVYFPDLKNLVAEALFNAIEIKKKQGKSADADEIRLNLISNYPGTEWAAKVR